MELFDHSVVQGYLQVVDLAAILSSASPGSQ